MNSVLVLYIPALHAGYLTFFKKYAEKAGVLFVIGEELAMEFSPFEREIRALPSSTAKKIVAGLGIFKEVRVLTPEAARELNRQITIVMADEEVSRKLAEKYFGAANVEFDPIFLRWDKEKVLSQKPPEGVTVSADPLDHTMMEKAKKEGAKSSDWWRQVGAVAVRDGEIILEAHNHHVPSEQMPYAEGDPRDFITAGEKTELATALHAEQSIVAEAARQGISLEGTSLYVSVFPCALCAKLIAYSGIKKCYFSTGSATLDGERILKSLGVSIILVP